MRTREQLLDILKELDGKSAEIMQTQALFTILEILLDIREELKASSDKL